MKKKILITGATGFVGSHLTELCVKKGFEVVAFDRYNSNYNLGWLEKSKYKKNINFQFGDIRDYDSVLKTMKGCEFVFHLAALTENVHVMNKLIKYAKSGHALWIINELNINFIFF